MRIISKILEVHYHRNGIGGNGFHAVRFLARDEHDKLVEYLATVFEVKGNCAVICLDYIPKHGVSDNNQWRCEYFENRLRAAIRKYERGRSKIRLGHETTKKPNLRVLR